MNIIKTILAFAGAAVCLTSAAQNNIAEEVAWMVGDEPIYKSEIEQLYKEYLEERAPIDGDPYCVLPELLALQKLYMHQAELDTIVADQAQVQAQVDAQINYYVASLGSREKVEQYFRKPLPALRELLTQNVSTQYITQQVQRNLTENFKSTPSEVRKYFDSLPEDSVPFVPRTVEVQMISISPVIPQQEIDDVKARLREYSERVNNGEAEFSTLAILYSEAPEGIRGGEIGFTGRGQLVPEFAAVAFNLNDPKKVSKIVETEYGFHIIQLIEKRGDRINCRHILLRPKVAEKDLAEAIERLDSVRHDIVDEKKMTFEEAVRYYSQDKDTRFSKGVMINPETGTTHFEMSELPTEVARQVAQMQPGDISNAFVMTDPKSNREQVVIVKLTSVTDAHRANLSDDFQLIKDMYENAGRQKILDEWIAKKIKETYVRIEDGWRGCDFKHEGWIK